jgi:hypothetical protein
MKKTVITITLLMIFGLSGYSQIEKRTILLGGFANFIFNNEGDTYFSINPNSGLFLADKFCLGISFPMVYNNSEFYWGLNPFARYYFKKKNDNSIFLSGAVGITSLLNSENTISPGLLSIGIGHVWFLNQSVGFETELIGSTNFEDISIGLHLGFQIYLKKKTE